MPHSDIPGKLRRQSAVPAKAAAQDSADLLLKTAERLCEQLRAEGKEVVQYVVGRKGVAYYTFRQRELAQSWTGFSDSPVYADAKRVADPMIESVIAETAEGGADELHIVYTEFVSMMTQTPVAKRLLPLSLKETTEAVEHSDNKILPLYEFEPSAEDVLDALLPRYVESRVYNALLQAAASEHAARRRAMKSATDNAEELIKSLTRLANAARQADITQEISEIVGGASALADATAGSDR